MIVHKTVVKEWVKVSWESLKVGDMVRVTMTGDKFCDHQSGWLVEGYFLLNGSNYDIYMINDKDNRVLFSVRKSVTDLVEKLTPWIYKEQEKVMVELEDGDTISIENANVNVGNCFANLGVKATVVSNNLVINDN